YEETDQYRLAAAYLTLDESPGSLELLWVIANQEANEHVGVDTEHQRESCSTGTRFRPFLWRLPARLITLLFLTRIRTRPSGINVNVMRSPAFMPRLSRICLGIVVWPLLVRVASVLMIFSAFLTG